MRAAAWTQRKLRRITARGSCPDPWRAGSAASSTPLAELPLFLDAAEAGLDRLQAVVQPQARSLERWPAVVGQGAAYRRAVALHDLRLRVAPALDLALDRSDPTHHLLQLFLGMPVGLKDRQGGFAQVVEMAQLVRHVGPDLANGEPDRMLAVADHADDRNPNSGQFRRDLAQQTGEIGAGEIGAGRRQQGAGQQDQPGQALADHPQHLVTDVGLKTVDRQDRPALALQGLAMRRRPGRGGDQLVVALEQVGHATLADRHAAPAQLLVDLRDAAVLTVAQGADQRDHLQPELVLRQRQGGFRLRPPRLMIASTAPILAAPNLQAQANQAPQRHDRPTVAVADPHRPPTLRAGRPERNQDLLVRRLHTAPTSGHLLPPCSTPPDTLTLTPSTDSRFCRSCFFLGRQSLLLESALFEVREVC